MKKAFSIIDVVISATIFSIVVTALVSFFIFFQKSSLSFYNHNKAVLVAEEGIEAVKNMKDANFSNLTDGTFGLTTSTNIWSLNGTSDVTDIFERNINISTVDVDRKQVVSTVVWNDRLGGDKTVSLTSILANWAKEVLPPSLSWTMPTTTYTINLNSTQNAWKVTIQNNYAYIIRQGSSPDLYIYDLTDISNPIALGSLNLSGNLQNIFVSGNYAYITSDDNSNEFIVVNISNPNSPIQTDSLNLSGNTNALGVFYQSGYAYVVRQPENSRPWFSVVNVSNPNDIIAVGTINGNSMPTPYEVYVKGNYAYVTTNSDTTELRVINVTNKNSPSSLTTYNLPGTADALTIAGLGNNIMIGRSNGEINILDISNPATPTLVSTYNNFTGSINDVIIAGPNNEYIFAASSATTAEFQIIDITDINNPVLVSSMNFSDILQGVAYYSTEDSIIVVGNGNNEEVIILSPS